MCNIYVPYDLTPEVNFSGEESCILIDTLESFEAAEEVKKAFQEKVPDKPIVAIILVTIDIP
jgi:alkyl sulfatase BDS1-like metallo-beta-lactamase superfamily hydrolase